jgi:uncharacterized HAD superfamily protein
MSEFNFVSYETFVKDILDWARQLPKYDLVVGIPRSGMIPATILSLYWNVPLASLKDFVEGKLMGSGNRLRLKPIKRVLIVDDSIFRGVSLNKAKEILKDKKEDIDYGAVYSAGIVFPEHYYKVVKQTRAFQWNWLGHKELMGITAWDIDGCLCVKPSTEQNDDGEKYKKFLLETKPLHIPEHPIGMIVTSRLEKYRPETEEWLKKHGVKYQKLIMLNYPYGELRRMFGHHAYHKSEAFKQFKVHLFIEDEPWQAEQIARSSGKPCLCINNWRVYRR